MLQYRAQSEESPEATNSNRESPSQTSAKITSWSWRRSRLRRVGLADARGEASGEAAGSLLIKQGQSDDLGAAALIASVCHLLSSRRQRPPHSSEARRPIATEIESLQSRILALSQLQSYKEHSFFTTSSHLCCTTIIDAFVGRDPPSKRVPSVSR